MKSPNASIRFALSVSTSLALGSVACAGSNEVANPTPQTTSANLVGTTPQSTTSTAIPEMRPAPTDTTTTTMTTSEASAGVSAPSPGAATPYATSSEPTTFDDGQIGTILSAIDNAEIATATIAVNKSTTPRVKQLARQILNDYRAVENRLQVTLKSQSITPEDSSLASKLSTDNLHLATKLGDQSGSDFDHGYIAAEIQGHQGTVDLIDNMLIPNVKNAQLRSGLEATRARVVAHLAIARDVQTSLNP